MSKYCSTKCRTEQGLGKPTGSVISGDIEQALNIEQGYIKIQIFTEINKYIRKSSNKMSPGLFIYLFSGFFWFLFSLFFSYWVKTAHNKYISIISNQLTQSSSCRIQYR